MITDPDHPAVRATKKLVADDNLDDVLRVMKAWGWPIDGEQAEDLLYEAAWMGAPKVAAYFLDHVSWPEKTIKQTMMTAMGHEQLAVVDLIAQKYACKMNFDYFLYKSIDDKRYNALKTWFQHVPVGDDMRKQAAFSGQTSIMTLFLVDATVEQQWTALQAACSARHLDCIAVVIDALLNSGEQDFSILNNEDPMIVQMFNQRKALYEAGALTQVLNDDKDHALTRMGRKM